MTPIERLDARAEQIVDFVWQTVKAWFAKERPELLVTNDRFAVRAIGVLCRCIAEDREHADRLERRIEELERKTGGPTP